MIVYENGISNPAKDWPYVQPGTTDGWGRARSRAIWLTLADEPRGVYILRIALVDVSPGRPPVLQVAINGHEGRFSANPEGLLVDRGVSLLAVAELNIQLLEVRQADDGTNMIARLWESAGKETVAHLDVKALGVKKASACNLVEAGADSLEVNDGVIAVPLRAHGVATVRLELYGMGLLMQFQPPLANPRVGRRAWEDAALIGGEALFRQNHSSPRA